MSTNPPVVYCISRTVLSHYLLQHFIRFVHVRIEMSRLCWLHLGEVKHIFFFHCSLLRILWQVQSLLWGVVLSPVRRFSNLDVELGWSPVFLRFKVFPRKEEDSKVMSIPTKYLDNCGTRPGRFVELFSTSMASKAEIVGCSMLRVAAKL